ATLKRKDAEGQADEAREEEENACAALHSLPFQRKMPVSTSRVPPVVTGRCTFADGSSLIEATGFRCDRGLLEKDVHRFSYSRTSCRKRGSWRMESRSRSSFM